MQFSRKKTQESSNKIDFLNFDLSYFDIAMLNLSFLRYLIIKCFFSFSVKNVIRINYNTIIK